MKDVSRDFELVPCPTCLATPSSLAHEGKDWALNNPAITFRIVHCDACGFHYLNPRPKLEILGRYYTDGYAPYSMGGDDKPASSARALVLREAYGAPAHRPRAAARVVARALITLRGARHFGFGIPWHGQGRLLDFGCGAGKFLKRMHAVGWHVTGVDFSDVAVSSVRQSGLKALQGSLPHPELSSASFDVVTMRHALEHVPDPVSVLRAAKDLLTPGGKLVIQVPNFASWEVAYFGDAAELLDLPRHLNHFTPQTLAEILRRAGFVDVDVQVASYASRLRKSAKLLKPGVRGPARKMGALLRLSWMARLAAWGCRATNRGNELIATAST